MLSEQLDRRAFARTEAGGTLCDDGYRRTPSRSPPTTKGPGSPYLVWLDGSKLVSLGPLGICSRTLLGLYTRQAWAPHPSAGDPIDARSTAAVFALFRRAAPVPPFVLVRVVRQAPPEDQPPANPARGAEAAGSVVFEVEDVADPASQWLVSAAELRPCTAVAAASAASASFLSRCLLPALPPPPADLSDLPVLHDAALLWAAGERWAAGLPSTRLGPRALVSLPAPPPWLGPGDLCVGGAGVSPRTVRRTRHRLGRAALAALSPAARADAEPPLGPCLLAEDALQVRAGGGGGGGYPRVEHPSPSLPQELVGERRDCALLFTGEGSAGKSRAWDAALAYLCCVEAADAEVSAAVAGSLRRGISSGSASARATARSGGGHVGGSPLRSLATSHAFLVARRRWADAGGGYSGDGDESDWEAEARRAERVGGGLAPSVPRLPLAGPFSPLSARRTPRAAPTFASPFDASGSGPPAPPLSAGRVRAFQFQVACGAASVTGFLDAPLEPDPASASARIVAAATVLRVLTRGAVPRNTHGSLAGVAVRLWVELPPHHGPAVSAAEGALPLGPSAPIIGGEFAVINLDTRGVAAAVVLPRAASVDASRPTPLPPPPPAGGGSAPAVPRIFLLLFQAATALSAAGGALGEGAALSDPRVLRALPPHARIARLAAAEADAARADAGLRGGLPEDSNPALSLGEWLAVEAALRALGGREAAAAFTRVLAGVAALCDVEVTEAPDSAGGSNGERRAVVRLSAAASRRYGDLIGHGTPQPYSPSDGAEAAGGRLDDASELLGVSLPTLAAALTTRRVARGATGASAGRTLIVSMSPAAALAAPAFAGTAPLTIGEARAAHAGLVRALYGRVVGRVVALANSALALPPPPPPPSPPRRCCGLSLFDLGSGARDGGLAALGSACEGLQSDPEAQAALLSRVLAFPRGGGQWAATDASLPPPLGPALPAAWTGGLHALLAGYAAERVEALHEAGLRAQAVQCEAEGVPVPPSYAEAAAACGALGEDWPGLVLSVMERPPAGLLPALREAAGVGSASHPSGGEVKQQGGGAVQHARAPRRSLLPPPTQYGVAPLPQLPQPAAALSRGPSTGAAAAAAAAPSALELTRQLLASLKRSGCVAGLTAAQATAVNWRPPQPGAVAPSSASALLPPPMVVVRHTAGDVAYDVGAWLAEQLGPDAPGGDTAASAAALLRESALSWPGAAASDADDKASRPAAAPGGLVEAAVAAVDRVLAWADTSVGAALFWVRCVTPHGPGALAPSSPSPPSSSDAPERVSLTCAPEHWDGNRVLAQLQWAKAVAAAALVARGWGWSAPHLEAYERLSLLAFGCAAAAAAAVAEEEGAAAGAPASLPALPLASPTASPAPPPLPVLLARLLRTLWAAYTDELLASCGPLEDEAAIGATRVFFSHRTAEALEALRAARVAEMDDAAVVVQVRCWTIGGEEGRGGCRRAGVRANPCPSDTYFRVPTPPRCRLFSVGLLRGDATPAPGQPSCDCRCERRGLASRLPLPSHSFPG